MNATRVRIADNIETFNLILTSLRIEGYRKVDTKAVVEADGSTWYYALIERLEDRRFIIFKK